MKRLGFFVLAAVGLAVLIVMGTAPDDIINANAARLDEQPESPYLYK